MKKILKAIVIVLLVCILLPLILGGSLYLSADMGEPELTIHPARFECSCQSDTSYCNNSYLYQNPEQIWELYVEGSHQERGDVQGALAQELMIYQQAAF